ncbi:hypothetical protein MMC13_006289 [Lambiella insularis]|nr:hypothetical protein [Lambiella insularis]
MLGRLFQSAASTFSQHGSSRPQTPLESVTEEVHTRDLLYPDVSTLRPSLSNSFSSVAARLPASAREAADYDDRGGLDVSYPSHVRIIVAQDANTQYHQPQILYDSVPLQKTSNIGNISSTLEHEINGPQPRTSNRSRVKPSLDLASRKYNTPSSSTLHSSQNPPPSPISPRSFTSRFSNAQAEIRSRTSPFGPPPSEAETTQGLNAREAREDTDALLGCMFGAPGFRIEVGTKLHILPQKISAGLNIRENDPGAAPPLSPAGFTRRRTPLVRSSSIADIHHEAVIAANGNNQLLANNDRPCIMFTKLFSVQLPDSVPASIGGDAGDFRDDLGSADLEAPRMSQGDISKARPNPNIKQKKVPMYAMSIILQFPPNGSHSRLKTPAKHHAFSSLGSSFNEVTPSASWNTEYSMFSRYMDMRLSGLQMGAETPLYSHVSAVLSQWRIISRSLELFELNVKLKLSSLLEQSAPLAPFISSPPPKSNGSKLKKPRQPSRQSVHVQSGCLQYYRDIQIAAEKTGQRITAGLRTRRVVTGQGRWGAWREEARWVGRWAGGREQNFFFFNLMTAFLGHHTSWLESFGPFWLKGRHSFPQSGHDRSDSIIQQRTVVFTADKMAARRLIFLLAMFLPDFHKQSVPPALPTLRSTKIYAESPPSISKAHDETLHNTIDKPATDTHKNKLARNSHARSVSFSLLGTADRSDSVDQSAVTPMERRMSDTRSLKSVTLALPASASEVRKTSTSTIVVESAVPVPHFTSHSTNPMSTDSRRARPGSSGSLASIALNHSLQRSDSTALSTSGSAGRWGSVVSGFWSNRRASSTDESDPLSTSHEGPADLGSPPALGKLSQMVEEVSSGSKITTLAVDESANRSVPEPILLDKFLKPDQDPLRGAISSARSILRKPKPPAMPLKISFNEDDGYLDIEMPQTRSFSSSLESSFNSSRLQSSLNADTHDRNLSHGLPAALDHRNAWLEADVDVAGWLKVYQPDFALQAVRPYPALKHDIKESMRCESQLDHRQHDGSFDSNGKWTDVCSTLIADTTTFSIHRLTLRRRLVEPPRQSPTQSTHTRASSPVSTRQINPDLASNCTEEVFVEEPIMDMDPTLIDAVERVLAQSGQSSRVHSRGPSPSRTRNEHNASRSGSVRMGVGGTTTMGAPVMELPHNECKNMVLGALEEVVRSVFAEQYHVHENDIGGVKGKDMPDSTLREGVRRWLLEVEDS